MSELAIAFADQLRARFPEAAVTVAEPQVATLPLTSVTVKITALTPVSEQSKVDLERDRVATPQLSVDASPPSTAEAVALADPPAPSSAVTEVHPATAGARLSSTVTVAEQVAAFPDVSVTVSVVDCDPTSAHVKALLLIVVEATPQLSLLPSLTSPATIAPFPLESSWTVVSRQDAIGLSSAFAGTF